MGSKGVNMTGTDRKNDTPTARGSSPRVRKDAHQERREREAGALAIVKAMTRSPSEPKEKYGPEPPPGKATNFKPIHIPGTPNARGFVYFAYCAGRIKIGYSGNAISRMGNYTSHTPFPVTLLLTIGANPEEEAWYHDLFAEERRHNEWFHLSIELRDFLDEHMGDDGFTMIFEVEHDFYTASKGSLEYITEIMEDIERYRHANEARENLPDEPQRRTRRPLQKA